MADSHVAAYHRELVARLHAVLGDRLVGVYAGGSWALGDYQPGRSDVDVAAVTRGRLTRPVKEAIVAAVRHEALHCPARGLELVAYSDAAAARPAHADFELNLNTGADMEFRADFEPGTETHWFAIDRAILAAHGIALAGPPPGDVFGPIPRRVLLDVLRRGIGWWEACDPASPDAVLNACRSLRFAAAGRWASKRVAAEWALDNGYDPELVRDALAARTTRRALDPRRVRRFLAAVETRLREQVARDETEHRR
ncbi:MAG TPA: aminoglycoside adenylyltransferase domain-containing protein [Gaiellaceae bacterium]|nr:aminoglycoside adenylyltransferase domain-containing protein [Gaiellaceae bacterium]